MLSGSTASSLPITVATTAIDQRPYFSTATTYADAVAAYQQATMPQFTAGSTMYSTYAEADPLQAFMFTSQSNGGSITAASSASASTGGSSNKSNSGIKRKPSTAGNKKDAVRSGGVSKQRAKSFSSSNDKSNAYQRKGSVASSNGDSSGNEDNDYEDGGEDNQDGGELTPEQKRRRRFLERNRIAASKCRQKKKMWIQELERRAEDVTMQNRSLHIAVAQLKEEVLILKNQLLAHRNCGCSAIQQYLNAECTAQSAADPTVAQAVTAAAVAASAGFPSLAAQPQPQPTLASPSQPSLPLNQPQPPTAAMAAATIAANVNAATTGVAAPSLLLQPPPHLQAPMLIHHQNHAQQVAALQSSSPYISNTQSMDFAGMLTTAPSSAASVNAFSAGLDAAGSTLSTS
ncbi:hypothetical protein GGI25_000347 [Coemansia spiralis]|uniref:BZIP domain-containing protein n=2 Tax=Coemansia TaxID=4863 RepID=A0A9W8L126_9FUNG|nr:hypothetical protein EDC05_000174 [Coemansia umbellata]KAJ2625958.1 hypothetical protein GGI26_000042 [Coemansia sp. RSA 1358]KAJ2680712.1 hypothetical protein GGI25_000347 [Coemansia spiralis]